MLSSIIKVKDKVEYLLENYPIFRDDDNKLIAKIWYSETKSKNIKDFLMEFGDKKISSPEAIRRARQKLQEQNSHLRGNLYSKRHKNGVKVKSNIKLLNFNGIKKKKTI
tara:strand:+ start:735 stop:1061 length:327 start_codon:yes stop_codon:yes gene_type:complete